MELFKQVGNNVGAWNGIVHRDIKPANVLLKWHDRCDKDTPYPEIVLSDFGHAIEMHDTISKFSNYNKYSVEQPSKIHFSTPDFSPPEHLRRYSETGERGELDPDESYDWYQFGALLYYMCTGYCFDIDSKDEPLHHAWNLYSFTALSIHSIPNLTLRHNPHKRMDDPNAKKCLPAWHRESQVAEKKAFRVDDYGTRHFLEAGPALERLIDIRLQADDPGGLNGGDVRENDHIPPPQPDFDGNQDENNDFPSLHGYNGRIEVIEGVSVPTPPTSSLPSTWAIPPNYTNSYRQTAPLPVNPCTGRRAGS
ncbi:hypothetical protein EJ08DRAFT_650580 [Tothia fuscella]|uniref:Protein kinase domain-containing protein n=1 Tax=Tothia fuscella TaxID=1048955 RepID=A0A9P4NP89_9PEZI|nr:hypothetical protein EJ08DRAFT_650580 [Tothia fuscella]